MKQLPLNANRFPIGSRVGCKYRNAKNPLQPWLDKEWFGTLVDYTELGHPIVEYPFGRMREFWDTLYLAPEGK